MSGWCINSAEDGVWQKWLADNKPAWLTYLICSYVPERLAKQGVRLLDFPEISMTMAPWGGFGANANPFSIVKGAHHGQNTCDKRVCVGGFPYCEGVFEDFDKVGCLMHYCNPDSLKGEDILREYASCYFSPEVWEELAPAIRTMEDLEEGELYGRVVDKPDHKIVGKNVGVKDKDGRTKLIPTTLADFPQVKREYDIVMAVDKKLPEPVRKSWRWRMVFVRAVMDNYLHDNKGVSARQVPVDSSEGVLQP